MPLGIAPFFKIIIIQKMNIIILNILFSNNKKTDTSSSISISKGRI